MLRERARTTETRRFKRYTVLLFAAILSVDAADRQVLGVVAPTLKRVFHVGNDAIGFLAAAFSIVGTLATVPVGVLTDRVRRTKLLSASVVVWSASMAVA